MTPQNIQPLENAADHLKPDNTKKENRSVIDELLQILKETKAAISANWRHENDIAELFVAFGG